MRILLCHSGHAFSTADTYTGILAGFRAHGCEVLEYRWDKHLSIFQALATAGIQTGAIPPGAFDTFTELTAVLSSAEAFRVAWEYDVDLVFVVNGLLFPPQRAEQIRKLDIPVACYGTEAPYFHDEEQRIAPSYSHWFTQERASVNHFAALGVPTTYLPMAYNPETHQPGAVDPDKHADVVFVGGGYPERKRILGGVDWNDISLVTVGTLWHLDLDAIQGERIDGRYTQGAIPNEETSAWHRSATIALNLHRQMTHIDRRETIAPGVAQSLGPRAYEIPAVGGFLLSDDDRPELRDVYGDSAATFRAWDSADLERQIRYWLSHDAERERVKSAQYAAVKPHTWAARAKTILEATIA